MENISLPVFGTWECDDVVVSDPGLRRYIDTGGMLVPTSRGRHAKKPLHKQDVHIVERFMNHLYVPGHHGKKHKRSSGHNIGKSELVFRILRDAFDRIENETDENPVQVLVKAVENGAPREEVVTYQRGGIRVRKAVIVSPQRRVDIALRHLAQGAYTSRDDKSAVEAIADEIVKAYRGEKDCKAVREKERREREASGAR